MSENESCSLSSESNRGRHAKMTGVEKERDRERGNNRTESSPRSAAVIIHPVLPLSPTSAAAGVVAVAQKGARKITFIRSEREREAAAASHVLGGGGGGSREFICRHYSPLLRSREREREEKESTSPSAPSFVGCWIVCRCSKRRVYTRNFKRKHNRKG